MNKLFPSEIEEFIKNNYKGVPNQELADMINAKFRTSYSKTQIKTYKFKNKLNSGLTGRFEKGEIPYNKGKKMPAEVYEKCKATMFKKGDKPKTLREIGSERINKDGYIEVKVSTSGPWKLKHRMVYENYYNVKLQSNDIITFLDDNPLNCNIDNLVLIKRSTLSILNQNFSDIDINDPEIRALIINLAKSMDKVKKIKKNRKEQNKNG